MLAPFIAALTTNEFFYKTEYNKRAPLSNLSVTNNLGQDGSTSFAVSSSGPEMYTLTHRPSVHFAEIPLQHVYRPWLPSELLKYQGFPQTLQQGDPRGAPVRISSFQPGGALTRADRKRHHMVAQSGNAVNISVAGAVWFYVLLYIQRADQLELFRAYKRMRQL